MNTTALPAPPKKLEEFPHACIAAWRALGAEIDAHIEASRLASWGSESPVSFGYSVEALAMQGPLIDRLPGWREALLRLFRESGDDLHAHRAFVASACVYLMEAGDLLSQAFIVELIRSEPGLHLRMRGCMPRSEQEQAQLVELVKSGRDAFASAVALDLIAYQRSPLALAQANRQKRERVIAPLLEQIDQSVLQHFGDDYPSQRAPNAQVLIEAFESMDPLLRLVQTAPARLRWEVTMALLDDERPKRREALRPHLPMLMEADPLSFVRRARHLGGPELPALAWRAGIQDAGKDGDELCQFAMERLLEQWRKQGRKPANSGHPSVELLKECIGLDPQRAHKALTRCLIDFSVVEMLWALAPEATAPRCLDYLAGEFENLGSEGQAEPAWLALARKIVLSAPERLADLRPKAAVAVLSKLPEPEIVDVLSPVLMQMAARARSLQGVLPPALARLGSAALVRLGWTQSKGAATLSIAVEALLLCKDEDAKAHLRTLMESSAISDADRDRVLRHLGESRATAADPQTQAFAPLGAGTASDLGATREHPVTGNFGRLEAQAADLSKLAARASKARIKPSVDKVWTDQTAELLAPLDHAFGRWLLSLASETKEDALTETALGLLAHVPAGRRAALAEHLLRVWLAHNGDRKLAWMLLFVAPCGDDRLVEPLFEAFKGWHKRAKPKAVTALQTLGRLDTAYALSHVFEVSRKSSYSDMIHEGAMAVLKSAAQRRGCDLAGLADEITPDFGLTPEGRVFDLGPHAYTMRVGTDLETSFTHSITGKTSKTLPKAKDGEDANARAEAETAIKLLKAGLKKVIKLQAQRLEDAMVLQRAWPAPRWRVLFVEHAVLGLIGQGLIWERLDAQCQTLGSFRISEDRSLIDASSTPVVLEDSDQLRLWHPATSSPAEVEAWAAHLADYEIKPFLVQIGRPVITLSDEEAGATEFKRYHNVRVAQSTLKYGLEGWNYQISDQDGSHIFGFERRFDGGLRVLIDTEDMNASLSSDAALGVAVFTRNRERIKLADVPAPLLSLVAEHFEKLAAKAVG